MGVSKQAFFDLNYLDILAAGESAVHQLNPKVKILVTLVFLAIMSSFGKYDVLPLLQLAAFPLSLTLVSRLPGQYLFKRILVLAPFAVLIGICNPWLDRSMLNFCGMSVPGGWVSFASILVRFVLSTWVALLLVATTGFWQVCAHLQKMGLPQVFVVQLLFLYRYIFVLQEEVLRMIQAREMRSLGHSGRSLQVFGCMAGRLLVRTLDRAERIYLAMAARGFDGVVVPHCEDRLQRADLVFAVFWVGYFVLMRIW